MKSKRAEKVFLNGNKFFMVQVTFLRTTEYKHLNFAELVNSIKAPVQEWFFELARYQ